MVDLNEGVIRLPGRITKNGKPRTVPIFEGDGDYMESLKAEKANHDEFYAKSKWVFSRVGQPIRRFDDEWRSSVGVRVVPISCSTIFGEPQCAT